MTGVAAGSPSRMARGINGNLLRSEAGACSNRGSTRNTVAGSADGVLDAVQNIDHAVDLLDGLGHLRAPIPPAALASGENSLICTGSGAFDRSPIMSCRSCTNSTSMRGFFARDLRPQLGDDFVHAAVALVLELHRDVAAIRFGDGRQAQLQARAPRSSSRPPGSRAAFAPRG